MSEPGDGDDWSNGGEPNDDGSNGGDNGGNDGGDGPSGAEEAVTAISVAFTVLLFGYVLWHAVTAPAGTSPQATVLGTETMDDDSVKVHVELNNPQDIGLETVVVESTCADPPPELEFEHVSAGDREVGYLVCPPGTERPTVSLAVWREA